MMNTSAILGMFKFSLCVLVAECHDTYLTKLKHNCNCSLALEQRREKVVWSNNHVSALSAQGQCRPPSIAQQRPGARGGPVIRNRY